MPASFDNIKDLMFVITLQVTGAFDSSGSNQVTMRGFRASVNIDNGGGNTFAHMSAHIWGVSQSDMNAITILRNQALSSINGEIALRRNTIIVYAIDGDQQTLVFEGNLINAWGNYQSQPDVFLQLEAQAAVLNRLTPIGPSSYKGAADVATIMGQLAATMGYTFENNNVQVSLSNPYFAGTGIDQARTLAQAAGIWWGIDRNTMWITPPYTTRNPNGAIPNIGPTTGLVGYPTFDGQGYINFQVLFNPAITFLGRIEITSSIARACGQWLVTNIGHTLESNKPGGAWFSSIRAHSSGLVATK